MNQIISQMLTVKSSPLHQSMYINLHNKILVLVLSVVIVQSNKSENQRKVQLLNFVSIKEVLFQFGLKLFVCQQDCDEAAGSIKKIK